VDNETAKEMDVLLQARALGRNTLIVHGISLRPQDMRAMAQVGASVCWCPSSNLYLYERTADIDALLEAGINVTLGTDSSLSGGLNLLEELRTAWQVLREEGRGPSTERGRARWLIESVTTHAAYALLRENHKGRIVPGYDADLLILPDRAQDPYTTLIDANVCDIALLIRAGIPIYGDPIYRPLFEWLTPSFTSAIVSDRLVSKPKLFAGDPLGLLARLSQTMGKNIELPFLPLAPPTQARSGCTMSAGRTMSAGCSSSATDADRPRTWSANDISAECRA
jgi:hypothetical protein